MGPSGVNPDKQSLEAEAAKFTQGEGIDLVVDNIGTRDSISQGLATLRPGGKLLVVGYLDATLEFPSLPLFKTELEIIGCRGAQSRIWSMSSDWSAPGN